jgi:hypothetical protein
VHAVAASSPAAPGAVHVVPVAGAGDGSIAVTGDLTDGTFAVSFENSIPSIGPNVGGYEEYFLEAPDTYMCFRDDAFEPWILEIMGFVRWTSSADVATPDLVPPGAWHAVDNPHAWRPVSPATGTPIVARSLSGIPTPPAIHTPPTATPGNPPAITL